MIRTKRTTLDSRSCSPRMERELVRPPSRGLARAPVRLRSSRTDEGTMPLRLGRWPWPDRARLHRPAAARIVALARSRSSRPTRSTPSPATRSATSMSFARRARRSSRPAACPAARARPPIALAASPVTRLARLRPTSRTRRTASTTLPSTVKVRERDATRR